MILKAIEFATAKHEGQFRKGTGKPYITHPIMVSYVLAQYKQSKNIEELICAALLHDSLEDTDTTFAEIANEFTPLVASLVLELTNDDNVIGQIGKLEYFKIKWLGLSNYGLILKLADRLSNLKDNPTDKTVNDTIELIKHVQKNRKLTTSQAAIATDILIQCTELKKSTK
jgi:guanosine-3',5'-bis(diphosphate) 3'-pyrophosphohydrolase